MLVLRNEMQITNESRGLETQRPVFPQVINILNQSGNYTTRCNITGIRNLPRCIVYFSLNS